MYRTLATKSFRWSSAGIAMTDSNGTFTDTYSNGEVTNPVASANYRFRGGIDTDKILISMYAKLKLAEGLHLLLDLKRGNTFDNRCILFGLYIRSSKYNCNIK
jgi:hypothetical protein